MPNQTSAVAITINSSCGSTTLATISSASRLRLFSVSATCTCTSGAPADSSTRMRATIMRTGSPCTLSCENSGSPPGATRRPRGSVLSPPSTVPSPASTR